MLIRVPSKGFAPGNPGPCRLHLSSPGSRYCLSTSLSERVQAEPTDADVRMSIWSSIYGTHLDYM